MLHLLNVVLLVFGGDACSANVPRTALRPEVTAERWVPLCSGYTADVELCLHGITRHGRLIVTEEGHVHLEHLDHRACDWVAWVLCPRSLAPGWNTRQVCPKPVRRVWARVGENVVLIEIHTAEACLKLSRHQRLASR